MTTPTCNACGAKFPGDPCVKCGVPAGLTKSEIRRLHIGERMEALQISERAAKATFGGSAGRKRRRHGRQVVSPRR